MENYSTRGAIATVTTVKHWDDKEIRFDYSAFYISTTCIIEARAKVFDFADMCHARFGAIYFKEWFPLNIWHYVV